MTPMVLKRPRAERDLLNHFVYIGSRRPAAADRFLAAAERAFDRLARFPLLGTLWESRSSRLVGIRFWPIPRFKNYVIFYRPVENGVEVLHVFHAARDIQGVLESEEADE